jgi:transmembrane sensor
VFASVLSVLMLVGIAQLLFPYWRADYVTGKGELQQISLESGAIIYLDSGVVLDVENAGDGTTVRLHRGRILVDSSAASPAQKPQVITDHARFTPIGTRFVITKRDDLSELVVTQGQVQLDVEGNSRVANAGESLQVINKTVTTFASNGMAPDAWVEGVIEANNARLGDVLDALSQHRRGWLRYDGGVADLRVNGIFYLNDTDKALTSLSNTLPITIETHAGWWTSVKPK